MIQKRNKTTGRIEPIHGFRKHELYYVWKNMHRRCSNSNSSDYKYYGERGIKVCKEWDSIKTFIEWAESNGYKKGLELDRTNNELGYSPNNCRWVTHLVNSRNSRRTKINYQIAVKIRAEAQPHSYKLFTELANKYNVSLGLIKRIVYNEVWIEEE